RGTGAPGPVTVPHLPRTAGQPSPILQRRREQLKRGVAWPSCVSFPRRRPTAGQTQRTCVLLRSEVAQSCRSAVLDNHPAPGRGRDSRRKRVSTYLHVRPLTRHVVAEVVVLSIHPQLPLLLHVDSVPIEATAKALASIRLDPDRVNEGGECEAVGADTLNDLIPGEWDVDPLGK